MTRQTTALERVEGDLRRGHTYVAIQRLRTLVGNEPTDLDLRLRLAEVYLGTGNLVEAGRWSYLSPDRNPAAVLAFERATPDPRARLRRLHWPAEVLDQAPEFASRTLTELEADSRVARRVSTEGVELTRGGRVVDGLSDVAFAGFVLVNLGMWVVGWVALLRWIL